MKRLPIALVLLSFASTVVGAPASGPDGIFQKQVKKYILDKQATGSYLFGSVGGQIRISKWNVTVPAPELEDLPDPSTLYVLDLHPAFIKWAGGVATEATEADAQALKPQEIKDLENAIFTNLNALAFLVGYTNSVLDKKALKEAARAKKKEHGNQGDKLKDIVDLVDLQGELAEMIGTLEKLIINWKKQEAKCWYEPEDAFGHISVH